MSRVYVIAEAGVNHNGSVERALEMIDAALAAGADAVKFQTFRSEQVISVHAPKAAYQKATTGADESQLDMVRALELDAAAHHQLVARCRERGIQFLSTPFDVPSVALLESLGVPLFKIPSGEITNPILLRAVAATAKPVIVSTGMATLPEVTRALEVLADAWVGERGAAQTERGRALIRERVTVLHCTTEYPAPFDQVNLRAIATMATSLGVPIGYSDHTLGIAVSIAAVALGATVIEKHFTLDRTLPGPDHRASLEPDELAAMIRGIREIETALGSSEKGPTPAERANMAVARKSLVAARAIKRGERFTVDNLTAKRPGTGVSAIHYDDYLERVADRDYEADELVG